MSKINVLKEKNVEVDTALEFWGDNESYNESLKEFLDSLDSKLTNLEYYKNNNDLNNYAILAHSMKSEAKYLGFMNEAEVFLNHELKGKENDLNYINANFNELKDTVTNIKNLLNDYFKEDSTSNLKKIIIADDSSIILNFIEKSIHNEFEVLKASNGKDALELLKNKEIYAILLDLNMPGLNGFEVLDYLKEQDLIEKIPVVVITGDDSEETIKKAFTYPILDILNKPFNEEKIERILTSIKSFYEHK